MLAASEWPKMPKTPHSSLNLSISDRTLSPDHRSRAGGTPPPEAAPSQAPHGLRYAPRELFRNRRRPEPFGFIDGDVDRRAASHRDTQAISACLSDHLRGNARGC